MDLEKNVQRVENMIYYTCGCNFDEAKEVLEACLKRTIQKKKDWNKRWRKNQNNDDSIK